MTGFHFKKFIQRKHFQLKRKRLQPQKRYQNGSIQIQLSQKLHKHDIEIGMLIGANCMKALEPLKIIPSKDGGPYAYQTKLGWCIVGPIQNVGHQNSLKCNRVAMNDASTGKLSRHHFLIENASKDMSIEQMFEQMYYSDFTEKGAQIEKIDGNLEQLSKNDRRFLEILDAGTRKNRNHYEVPLPFKQKGIKIKKKTEVKL